MAKILEWIAEYLGGAGAGKHIQAAVAERPALSSARFRPRPEQLTVRARP